MRPKLICSLAFVFCAGTALADAPLQSGPPVGTPNNRGRFEPHFVAGPFAGQNRCPV